MEHKTRNLKRKAHNAEHTGQCSNVLCPLFRVSSAPEAQMGFAVLYAVLTASLLLAIGLAIFTISLKDLQLSSQIRNSQQAIFAADAALECALFWDLKHPGFSASVFGGFTSANTLSNGLVGYWALNGDAEDGTSGDNDGTEVNIEASDWESAQIGEGVRLDGVDEYIDISGVVSDIDLSEGTFTAWVRFNSGLVPGQVYSIFEAGDAVDNLNFMGFRKVESNDTVVFVYKQAGVWLSAGGSHSSAYENTWKHIAGVWESDGSVRFYEDGVLTQTRTRAADIAAGILDQSRIGADGVISADGFFSGVIDEVRLYNRALLPEEIEVLSEQGETFFEPVPQNTDGVDCAGANITDPQSGWDSGSGWEVENPGGGQEHWTVEFDLALEDELCSTVLVDKDTGQTTIESRGYNTCDAANPYRVERALRATY